MSTFFDLPKGIFDPNSQFYFNVLVYEIGFAAEDWAELLDNMQQEDINITCITYTNYLTAERPTLYVLRLLNDIENDIDYDISFYDHQVVNINGTDISWVDMIDFDTQDLWRID